MPNVNPGPATQSTGNVAGGPYLAWSGTLTTQVIGPAGTPIVLGGGAGGVAVSAAGSSQSSGTVIWSNANGVSFGMNGSTITASVAGASAGVAALQISNSTYTSGTVIFQNANNISFGSSGANGVSASYAQSVQTQASGNIAATGFATTTSAGASIAGTLNTAGFTLGVPAYLTTAMASNAGSNFVGLNSAQTNATWTVNSSGISLNAAGYAGTATTFNGNGVSGSMTLNSAGLNLSLSGGAGGGATSGEVYLIGNTTGQSSASSYAFSSLNISATGLVSVGWSSNSLIFSAPGTTAATFAGTSFSTNTTTGSVLIGSINSAGVSLSVPAWITTGSGGVAIAASNSTFSTGTVVMSAAGGALTISNGAQSALFSVPATSLISGVSGIGVSTNGGTIFIYTT